MYEMCLFPRKQQFKKISQNLWILIKLIGALCKLMKKECGIYFLVNTIREDFDGETENVLADRNLCALLADFSNLRGACSVLDEDGNIISELNDFIISAY